MFGVLYEWSGVIGSIASIIGFFLTIFTLVNTKSAKKQVGEFKKNVLYKNRIGGILENIKSWSTELIHIPIENKRDIKIESNKLKLELNGLILIAPNKQFNEMPQNLIRYIDDFINHFPAEDGRIESSIDEIYLKVQTLVYRIESELKNKKIVSELKFEE